MKLGIVYCSYGVDDLLNQSLNPWVKAKSRHDISIAAVSTQFKEYAEMGSFADIITRPILIGSLEEGHINYLYTGYGENLEQEHIVRDHALQYLLSANCNYILLVDGDEIYTDKEIDDLIAYIKRNPLIPWFRIEFKNLTFSESTYTTGFRPPRVFKVNVGEYKLNRFVFDNDISYLSVVEKKEITQEQFASITVPVKICNPIHYSWISNQRSKQKIEYQRKHFKDSLCSFIWNDEKDCLEFNEEYFISRGISRPSLHNIKNSNL